MTKEFCVNCGTTQSHKFWNLDDGTDLCDKCYKHAGPKYLRKIKRQEIINSIILLIIILVVSFSIGHFFISKISQSKQQNTEIIPANVPFIQPPAETPTIEYKAPTTILKYCGDNICDIDESCSTCSQDCGICLHQKEKSPGSFTTYTDVEPYYGAYCEKIDPYDLNVRTAASKAIKKDPGSYSVNQLFDIYDWIKSNIEYQNVPLSGIAYPPSETLTTESGDCKNQAVLIASMIEAIGGKAKVVVDPTCEHAYTMVRFGDASEDISWFSKAVTNHYNSDVSINYIKSEDGLWVIFDPAGGEYPGDTLDECSGPRNVYYVDSCLSCESQYPDMPYTFGEKCFSKCPEGTVSTNNHACAACQKGEYSFDNKCVSCPEGYYLTVMGKCYPN